MRQLRRSGASPPEERGETARRGVPVRLLLAGEEEADARNPRVGWWLLRALCWELESLHDHRPPRMYLDILAQMIGELVGLEGTQIYELFDWDCTAEGLLEQLVERLPAKSPGETAPPAVTIAGIRGHDPGIAGHDPGT
jgi:hypothetical protein